MLTRKELNKGLLQANVLSWLIFSEAKKEMKAAFSQSFHKMSWDGLRKLLSLWRLSFFHPSRPRPHPFITASFARFFCFCDVSHASPPSLWWLLALSFSWREWKLASNLWRQGRGGPMSAQVCQQQGAGNDLFCKFGEGIPTYSFFLYSFNLHKLSKRPASNHFSLKCFLEFFKNLCTKPSAKRKKKLDLC